MILFMEHSGEYTYGFFPGGSTHPDDLEHSDTQ